MKLILIAILSTLFLNGCSWLSPEPPQEPIEVITSPSKFTVYHPPLPKEIKLEDIKWHVITPENLEEKIRVLERLQQSGFVIFAITPQEYEKMSYNMQELRRYIRQQNSIIIYYRSLDEVSSAPPQETTSNKQ